MKVSKAKETLNNPKMQNLETNFKLKKPGGGPKKPRKPPKYFTDFANEQREFNKLILTKIDNIDNRINNLDKRIDNLVKNNNLKE